MAHDVFISHSSKDKTVADAVCGTLEKQGVRCWIAPRDVPPGKSWAAAIVEAISNCKVFVLVFSDGSNQSKQVVNEVGEAFDNGIPIVPLRIEDVKPSQEIGYYIKSIHWLDAMNPPLERDLKELSKSVEAFLSVGEKDQVSTAEPVYEEPVKKRWPIPIWAIVLIVIAAMIIIGGIGIWAFSQFGTGTNPRELTEVAAQNEIASNADLSENIPETTAAQEVASDWHPLSFVFPKPQLWKESVENRYTTIGQHSVDAFAWSTEKYDGDLTLTFDLERPESESDGCVIIYGDGNEHSYGSLIFCVDWDGYFLEKHTVYYDEDENLLNYAFNDNETDEVYSIRIEINDDLASMDVNGENVLTTFFEKQEIDRSGRIGLYKKWFVGEITFSNIQIKIPGDGD